MSVEANTQTVLDFYKMAFLDKDPEKALALYVGDHYTQHNPQVGNGKVAFVNFVKQWVSENPGRKIAFKRVIAQADYVVVHAHHVFADTDREASRAPDGTAGMDIFRLEAGKIVEHWDVLQVVPAQSANDNTMF